MSDLVKRVNAVMADVGAISKDKENPHFHYMYVSAEAVRARVQKACVKHGLILRLTYSDETVSLTQALLKCTCSVSTDGSTFVVLGEGWGAGMDKSEKACLKANTSAAKYALANAFCIALGDDPEADAETDREPPRVGEKLSNPGYAYGPEERARADEQAATARQLAQGLIDDFKTIAAQDLAIEWVTVNAAAIDKLGQAETKRIANELAAYCDDSSKHDFMMNGAGLKDLLRDAIMKTRTPKHGRNGHAAG